jgi:hypothetical protein
LVWSPKPCDRVHDHGLTVFMNPSNGYRRIAVPMKMFDEQLFIDGSRAGTDSIKMWIAGQHSLMIL